MAFGLVIWVHSFLSLKQWNPLEKNTYPWFRHKISINQSYSHISLMPLWNLWSHDTFLLFFPVSLISRSWNSRVKAPYCQLFWWLYFYGFIIPWGCFMLFGYGSIPINTIFSGMNIHLPAILMFTRGTRFWHTVISLITGMKKGPQLAAPAFLAAGRDHRGCGIHSWGWNPPFLE